MPLSWPQEPLLKKSKVERKCNRVRAVGKLMLSLSPPSPKPRANDSVYSRSSYRRLSSWQASQVEYHLRPVAICQLTFQRTDRVMESFSRGKLPPKEQKRRSSWHYRSRRRVSFRIKTWDLARLFNRFESESHLKFAIQWLIRWIRRRLNGEMKLRCWLVDPLRPELVTRHHAYDRSTCTRMTRGSV